MGFMVLHVYASFILGLCAETTISLYGENHYIRAVLIFVLK
jgi:hypothetical protein